MNTASPLTKTFFNVLNAFQPLVLNKFYIKVVLRSAIKPSRLPRHTHIETLYHLDLLEAHIINTVNSINDLREAGPVRNVELNRSQTQHSRESLFKNSVSHQAPPQSSCTTPRQSSGESSISNTRKLLENIVLDNGTPLTKRPRLENIDYIEAIPKTNDNYRDGERRVVDVETTPKESTQVQEFRKSIQICREKCRPSSISEEIIEILSDSDSSNGDEEPIRPCQAAEVDWRDPDDIHRSERFSDLRSCTPFKIKKYFSMSLTIEVDPQRLKDQIRKLGGTVCEDSTVFDPSCTHLICSIPNYSEKTMSAVASGRWLLYPSYIEDSFKADHFLNEEEYEWGNPKAKLRLPVTNYAKVNKIAMVNHKRRKELQLRSKKENMPVGLFSRFRVILHLHLCLKDQFKRLIEAGGGVVVDIKEPYSEQKNVRCVTHCFVDKRTKKMSDTDMVALNKIGVHCVNILYLQAYFCADLMPNVNDYVVK